MPIRKTLQGFYPIDWRELSRAIRFERAKGQCEQCGRPHGRTISHLGDGRWFDPESDVWRDGQGRMIDWLDFSEYQGQLRQTRIVLATAHLDYQTMQSFGDQQPCGKSESAVPALSSSSRSIRTSETGEDHHLGKTGEGRSVRRAFRRW